MKKSQQVPAALVAALAASFTLAAGCNNSYRECRDAQGRVLPDSQCRSGGRGTYVTVPRVSSGGFGGTTSRPSGTFGG